MLDCYAGNSHHEIPYPEISQSLKKKKILILNSYHQNYHWADDIMKGVFSEFNDKNSYELYVEYMDTKRCSDSIYYEQLKNIYLHKYKNVEIDVILACDDNALNFMLQYRDEIFPQVPVSFCGVVDFHSSRIEDHELYTGVYESYDIPANLDLINKLHPEVNRVVIVSDTTESGKALLARIKRGKVISKSPLVIDYLINKTPKEIKDYLKTSQENTAVIWAIYLRLPNGTFISSEESIHFITSVTSSPVFCVWDVVGQGVVGGKVSTPFYQGAESARIAKRILSGEHIHDINILGSPMLYKFDYEALKKYKIPLKDIPEGSLVLNKPITFWQANKRIVTSLLFIIISLLAIVFALSYLYRKSKKVEIEIKRKNKKLKKVRNKLLITNEKLRKSKIKAEEGNRLKSAFLANLSHEIRTPMNGVVGFTSVLLEGDLNKDEQKLYLDLINSSGQKMVSLIDDLVNISKIESGTLELNYSEINLAVLFKEMFLFFEKEARDKGLILELVKDDDIKIINSDRNKLEQVFYNLIKNAIKYTEKGHIKFGYSKINSHIEFFVEDNGNGIHKKDFSNIFERFNQAENSNSTKGGIGLGLSIVKEFVDIIGGSIQVESEINKGSRFYFSIPLNTIQ